MSAPGNAEYELLTEHFSYPPVSLLDDIINAVNVLADHALSAVERTLIKLPAQNLGFANPKKRGAAPDAQPPPPSDAGSGSLSPAEAAKREIENGTHQLETLLNASIDKNFDKFELYTMRNILTVNAADQPYMQLSHYKGLDFDSAAATTTATGSSSSGGGGGGGGSDGAAAAPTVQSVTQLRRRLHASQKLHVALETERVRNEALLQRLRAALGIKPAAAAPSIKKEEAGEDDDAADEPAGSKQGNALGFLRDRGTLEEGGTERPITTTTEFTLSQLQTLRALSSTLRTLIPDIDVVKDGDDEEEEGEGGGREKSWRRERAEYVEAASKRYLETVGGVEMGPEGEVRDGEWQGPGRGLARDEVQGLEAVVAMLGAHAGAASASASADADAAATGQDEASGEGGGQDESMDLS